MVEHVLEDRRSFIGPDGETEYFISNPTAEAIRAADWQYSKMYTKCLSEGITTSAEMTDILKRRGVLGEQFDSRVEELTAILNENIMRLDEATDNESKAAIAVEVSKARDALFQWNQRLSGPMSNTCEQIADDARLEILTSFMVEYADGTRVWESHDDFMATRDQALTLKARYEAMLFLQGYDSDFLDKTPEALAMQEVQADIIRQVSEEAEAEAKVEKTEEKKPATKPKRRTTRKTTTKKTK